MSTKRVVDRTDWLPGPWDTEPDRMEWRSHGMPCLIVRNDAGYLCGYVGVSPGHQHYEVEYENVHGVMVHGGLTYSDKCAGHICHVPEPGEEEHVWWLGFDCAHLGDCPPGEVERFGVYRDILYVRAEVEHLAEQLAS